MKKLLFIVAVLYSIESFSQTNKYPTNLLFKDITSDSGYSGYFSYWTIQKTVPAGKDTVLELCGFDLTGELQFKLKLDKAEYCKTCREMDCAYNGIQFQLYNQISTWEDIWKKD